MYKLIFVRSKEDFKIYLKIAITRILGILIPVVAFFIYLLITQSLGEFINYAVLGISEFSNSEPYLNLLKNEFGYIRVLSIIMPIILIIMLIIFEICLFKKKKSEVMLNIATIFIYAVSILAVLYPISDEVHFLFALIVPLIGGVYLMYIVIKWIYEKIKVKEKLKALILDLALMTIDLIVIFFTLNFAFENIKTYVNSENKNQSLLHYENLIVEKSEEELIQKIANYVKNQETKKVYIVDSRAAYYKIPTDIYDKNYDMFLIGNLGKDGENKIINEIQNREENVQYLVLDWKLEQNWQAPMKVIDYIRNNLENKRKIFNI